MQYDKVFVSKHWFWFKFCGVHWQQWIHTNPRHWKNTALFSITQQFRTNVSDLLVCLPENTHTHH